MLTFSYLFPLLENFFLSLRIQSTVLLLKCSSDETKVNVLRRFSGNYLSASFSYDSIIEHPLQRRGAVLDITCDDSLPLLKKLSANKEFNMGTEWLLLKFVNGSELQNFNGERKLREMYMLPGSCVTLGLISQKEMTVHFYEVYRASTWTKMKYNHLTHQPIEKPPAFKIRGNRSNFEAVTYRSASVVLYPEFFAGLGSLEHTEIDTYSQVSYVIVKNMAHQLNFSFTLLLLYDYGYLNNDSFTGLIGYLLREELDFGTSAPMMRNDRMDVVDFAGNIYRVASPLIFRQPSLSAVSNIFVLPFNKTVWIAFIVLSILTTFTLFLDLITSIKVIKNVKSEEMSLDELVMAIIGHISQQGTILQLRTGSGQLILALFSFFSFFLSIAYSAKIVALLQSSTNTIKTLPQLIDSPLAVGIQDVMYNKVSLQESQDKDVERLFHKKILPRGNEAYLNPNEGIKKVRSGLYVYKAETNWAYKVISDTFKAREKCGLYEMHVFPPPMLSIAVPKKSGLREHICRSLCWQREIGLIPRAISRAFTHKPACNSKGIGYTSVHLRDFQPALIAFIFGVIVTTLIFIMEITTKMRFQFIIFFVSLTERLKYMFQPHD